MSNKIYIDLNKLTQLYPLHSQQELAEIFGCSISTIKVRLRNVGAVKQEHQKEIEKPEKRRFSPRVREMLMENCL